MFFLFSDFSFLKVSRRRIEVGFEGMNPKIKKAEIREWETQILNTIGINNV